MSNITIGNINTPHDHSGRKLKICEEPYKEVEASGNYFYIRDRNMTAVFHRSDAAKLAKFLNEELVLDVLGDL